MVGQDQIAGLSTSVLFLQNKIMKNLYKWYQKKYRLLMQSVLLIIPTIFIL